MAVILQQLVAPQFLAASDTVYYTAPITAAGQPAITAKITRAVFYNSTGGAVTVTAGICPASTTLAAGNEAMVVSIPAGGTHVSNSLAGAVIPSGSSLRAFAGAGSSVNIMVSGLTVQ